jgi:hypothetical protein
MARTVHIANQAVNVRSNTNSMQDRKIKMDVMNNEKAFMKHGRDQ